jgi:hypothetical protein
MKKYRIKPEYSYGRVKFSIYEVKTHRVYGNFFTFEDEEYENYICFGVSMADAEEIVQHLCSEVKEIECQK